MIRWFALAGIVLLTLTTFTACGESDDADAGEDDANLTIVATTSIIASLAEQVAGDEAEITALIGPGVDPHLYEPAPGDIRTASDADLILMNGIGLDNSLVDNIESTNPNAPVVVVTDGIELREGGHAHEDEHEGEEEGDDEEHDHEHGDDEHSDEAHSEGDPHVWQDPTRAEIMVDNITAALSDVDPDHAAAYEANAESYKTTLQKTDAEIRALMDEIPPENRKLVTNHDSLGYFAERYGLEVVATVIPNLSTDADPSAQQIAELADLIERVQIPAIFTERLVDPKVAEQLASDTSVTIIPGLYTDSPGEPGSGAETLHGMLLENAKKIREGLG